MGYCCWVFVWGGGGERSRFEECIVLGGFIWGSVFFRGWVGEGGGGGGGERGEGGGGRRIENIPMI